MFYRRRRLLVPVAVAMLLAPSVVARQSGDVAAAPHVRITTQPAVVCTSTQEGYVEASTNPPNAHATSQNVTWMFHLNFESADRRPLRIEQVDATFTAAGAGEQGILHLNVMVVPSG